MQIKSYILICCLFFSFIEIKANDILPSVEPTMTVDGDDGGANITEFTGSAPAVAHLMANPKNLGNYTALYEWRFYKDGKEDTPELLRYDEDTDYTFISSGTIYVTLLVNFVQGTDTIKYESSSPFTIIISESKLEVPNAFSPNGDGQNDVFKVKEGYQSIISFHGYIYNRWGKRLFEWTDIDKGWDGTVNGTPVKDGVYFCIIKAMGADGRKYEIKRDVNVLRKFYENSTSN